MRSHGPSRSWDSVGAVIAGVEKCAPVMLLFVVFSFCNLRKRASPSIVAFMHASSAVCIRVFDSWGLLIYGECTGRRNVCVAPVSRSS